MSSLWSYFTGSSTPEKPLNPPSMAQGIDQPQSPSRSASEPSSPSSSSSSLHQAGQNKFVTAQNPTGIKPCCACPETKKIRDDCLLVNGPEAVDGECKDVMQRHRECMAQLGFKV